MSRSVDLTLRMAESSEKAAALLKKQELRMPIRPEDRLPILPEDITSLHDENLMDLFVKFTSWVDYVSVQVACAQIDERASQRTVDLAEANALIAGWTGGREDRIAIARAKQAADPEVIRLYDESYHEEDDDADVGAVADRRLRVQDEQRQLRHGRRPVHADRGQQLGLARELRRAGLLVHAGGRDREPDARGLARRPG